MRNARILIILLGVLLPYLARLPGGLAWLAQYAAGGWGGFLLVQAFNVIAWGLLLGVSFIYRHLISLAVPAALGFGFLAWAHYTLDLAAEGCPGIHFYTGICLRANHDWRIAWPCSG
jgi:hypothetical protein